MKWISYVYSYTLSLLDLRPKPLVITAHQAELPVLYSSFPLAMYFTHGSVYMSILISQLIPPCPSHWAHAFILSDCVSIPDLQ